MSHKHAARVVCLTACAGASDAGMRQLVARGNVVTNATRDFTVKIDVSGLLPRPNVRQVRLAVFSCANYPAGYFNVYADTAKLNDLDAALHIGDYIYEYESTGYALSSAKSVVR